MFLGALAKFQTESPFQWVLGIGPWGALSWPQTSP